MTLWPFLVAAGAGGLGAGLRYVVDVIVMRGRKGAFPLGILIVNVSGSFALGLLTGLGSVIGPEWMTIFGIGLLGGYTTFSTVSVETALLAETRRRAWAWMNLAGTLVAATAAAGAGLAIGRIFA
jgi:CrcB protein